MNMMKELHNPIIITSRISGRGNRIGPVCLSVCVSVCQLVSALTAKQIDMYTDLKIGTGFGIDDLSDEFDG